MPGPAPKHPSVRARRNNPRRDFRSLPSGGRAGKAPQWPLPPDPHVQASLEFNRDRVAELQVKLDRETDGRKRGRLQRSLDRAELLVLQQELVIQQTKDSELELWSLLWSTPQATMWDESPAFARMLAQFVRWNVKAEQGDKDAAVEARLRGGDFGLTPKTLLGLRAEIERVEDAEDRGRRRRTTPASKPAGKKKGKPDDPRGGLFAVS